MSHVSRQIVVVDPLFGIRHKLQQRGGGSMLEFRQFEGPIYQAPEIEQHLLKGIFLG